MKKLAVIFLVIFTLIVCVSACEARAFKTARRDYGEAIKTARENMWRAITQGHGSGATVAVSDEGRIVYAEGIGAADRASNRPVGPRTRFNVGSTSKMFAAVAVLLLVDDGKVALDEPVVKYVPDFRMKDPRYKDITVRMLFNHSSGLPGSTFYFGYETDPDMHKYMLDALAESYLKHAPGAMPIYCNDGFTLAEIVVERVSGEKFVDFLAKRVFKPLGMKDTGPSIGEARPADCAEHYGAAGGKKMPREVVMVYGAGGLSSTASDLCRFANSFSPYGKRILSQSSLGEILREQPNMFSEKLRGPSAAVGFGWDYSRIASYEAKGVQVLAKSGGTACYNTYIQTAPDLGVTVVYSISGTGIDLEGASRPILDAMLRVRGIEPPAAPAVEKPADARAIPEEMTAYEGYYTGVVGVVKVRFDMANKKCELLPLVPAGAAGEDFKAGAAAAAPPVLSMVYAGDGLFSCIENNSLMYFTTIDGEKFIASHKNPRFGTDAIKYIKIAEIASPKKLNYDLAGKKWLVRNMARHVVSGGEMCVADSAVYKELPGYVDFCGLKKVEGPEYAGIAAVTTRDQTDLRLFNAGGETWLRAGMFVYSDAARARKLVSGVNRVVIKADGFNEWLRADKGAVVKFAAPPAGARIAVFAGEDVIFDSAADKDEIYVPEGGFIFFAGRAGDMLKAFAR